MHPLPAGVLPRGKPLVCILFICNAPVVWESSVAVLSWVMGSERSKRETHTHLDEAVASGPSSSAHNYNHMPPPHSQTKWMNVYFEKKKKSRAQLYALRWLAVIWYSFASMFVSSLPFFLSAFAARSCWNSLGFRGLSLRWFPSGSPWRFTSCVLLWLLRLGPFSRGNEKGSQCTWLLFLSHILSVSAHQMDL